MHMHLAKNERGLDLKTKGSQLGNVENIATGEKNGTGSLRMDQRLPLCFVMG